MIKIIVSLDASSNVYVSGKHQSNIINALLLEILSLKESCRLLGQKDYRLYFKNKNFHIHKICTAN